MVDLTALHFRRLRDIWRSAGWPWRDTIEVELLAAGLLQRIDDESGREIVRVTDAGIQAMADARQRNRAARDAHEGLVASVAIELQRAGRIAWRGLSLRARVGDLQHPQGQRWQVAMPDVYSVRHTSVSAYLQPEVHEIKVRRADLLSDVRRSAKREAYLAMAGACWYVLAEGIGEADDVPPDCGVLVARTSGGGGAGCTLEVLRAAPTRRMPFESGLPFAVWMALARATPVAAPAQDEFQRSLGEPPGAALPE